MLFALCVLLSFSIKGTFRDIDAVYRDRDLSLARQFLQAIIRTCAKRNDIDIDFIHAPERNDLNDSANRRHRILL